MVKRREPVVSTEPDRQPAERPNAIRVEIELLTHFKVRVDGVAVPDEAWKLTHPRRLLELLCLQPGQRLHRDLVVEQLWPESDAKAAANRLYHTVHVLRGLLKNEASADARPWLVFRSGELSLAPHCKVTVDALEFIEWVARARACKSAEAMLAALQKAVALLGNSALTDDETRGFATRRDEIRREFVWALECLAATHEGSGKHAESIACWRRLVEIEPANEPAHRRLMTLFEATGEPERALQQFTACKRYLKRDLTTIPAAETLALRDAIVERLQAATLSPTADAPPAPTSHYNAPLRGVPMLGRDDDLAALSMRLADGRHRLVTITAGPGMGKTRLACALAESIQGRYRDGALVVALTTLTDSALVEEAICQAAGWELQNETAATHLPHRLSSRQMLLVLDRFEHLVDAATRVSGWLSAAPELHIVVTSQCPLDCGTEWLHRLPALTHAARAAALDLFVQTAGITQPQTPEQIDTINEITARIEGNPLAIELVAARAATTPLETLRDEVALSLVGFVNPRDDAEAPQHSLLAAIGWSAGLLDRATRRLLGSVAVFAGSFSVDQAHAVSDVGASPAQTRAGVQSLFERHLLTRAEASGHHGGDSPMFSLLDSVRQYAQENALDEPLTSAVSERHAALFLDIAQAAFEHLRTGRTAQAKAMYRAAAADIDKAMRYRVARASRALQFELTYKIAGLQVTCGRLHEAQANLSAVVCLDTFTQDDRHALGSCWHALSLVYSITGQKRGFAHAVRMSRHSLAGSGNTMRAHQVATRLCVLRGGQLRFRAARLHIDRALTASAATGDALRSLVGYNLLSSLQSMEGQHARAIASANRSLDLALQIDNPNATGMSLQALMEARLWSGRLAEARDCVDECFVRHATGLQGPTEFSLNVASFTIAFEQGDFSAASVQLDKVRALEEREGSNRPFARLLFNEFVLMETAREHEVSFVRTVAEDDFPLDFSFAFYFVKLHCYRLRLQTSDAALESACETLSMLARMARLSQNRLWASWVAEACAYAMAAIGDPSQARGLLGLSQDLQRLDSLRPSPRQEASWDRLRLALEASHRPALSGSGALELRARVVQVGAALRLLHAHSSASGGTDERLERPAKLAHTALLQAAVAPLSARPA